MSNLKPETLEVLREALEAKVVVRHVPDFVGDKPQSEGTNSYEPDPAYAPLLALVKGDCPARGYHYSCADYWAAAPDGALAGALLYAMWRLWERQGRDEAIADVARDLASLQMLPDCDQVTVEVVTNWLRGR